MTDTFNLTLQENGHSAIIHTEGYVNNLGGEKIREASDQCIAKGIRNLIINFENSSVVNSIGISILIEVIEKIVDLEGSLTLRDLKKSTCQVLDICGYAPHVSVNSLRSDDRKSLLYN